MQTADHLTTKPEGPVFLFFNKAEGEYETASRCLTCVQIFLIEVPLWKTARIPFCTS